MAEQLHSTQEWDKVFPKSDKISHKKVTFHNHFGITLVADTYTPKNASGKLPALAVSGPFGAVKGQSSGLYARGMVKHGFLTVAFDPSYTGESAGFPRYMQSPDVNTEDSQAAVDYLSILENVDVDKVGIIGICDWGGTALNAAAIDPRIKVTVISTMCDMSRMTGNGYFDMSDNEESRYQMHLALANQRTEDYKNDSYKLAGGVVGPLPEDAPQFVKDHYAYYKQPRDYHARSLDSNNGWAIQANASFLNTRFLYYTNEIRNAVLLVHGDKTHSYYMGKDVFEKLAGDNEGMISAASASYCGLYNQKDIIPFDDIENFINENLSK